MNEKNEMESTYTVSDRTHRVYGRIRRRFNSAIWNVIRTSTIPGQLDEAELESIANNSLLFTLDYYGKARREVTRQKIAARKAKLLTLYIGNFKKAILTEKYKLGIVEDPYYRTEGSANVGKKLGRRRIPVGQYLSIDTPIGDSDDEEKLTIGQMIADDGYEARQKKQEMMDVIKKKVTDRVDRKILMLLYTGTQLTGRDSVANVMKLSQEEIDKRLKNIWKAFEQEGFSMKQPKEEIVDLTTDEEVQAAYASLEAKINSPIEEFRVEA